VNSLDFSFLMTSRESQELASIQPVSGKTTLLLGFDSDEIKRNKMGCVEWLAWMVSSLLT
jgi:hypothetical protein